MVRDPSPAVRIVGAKCIVDSPWRKIDQAVLDPLIADTTEVMVGPGGCVFMKMTVGGVVLSLERDPNFLGAVGTPVKLVSIPTKWSDWEAGEWR